MHVAVFNGGQSLPIEVRSAAVSRTPTFAAQASNSSAWLTAAGTFAV